MDEKKEEIKKIKTIPQGVPVLVVGGSGTGKSSSTGLVMSEEEEVLIQGLPPENTVFINTELQPMPTENYAEFNNIYVENWVELTKALDKWIRLHKPKSKKDEAEWMEKFKGKQDPRLKWKYLVFDSFTSATEMLQRYCTRFNGWEAWNQYNLRLVGMISKFKQLRMQCFVLGIPERNDDSNDGKTYLAVKGKEMKFGKIEKEFVIVLHTKPIYDEESVDGEMIASTFTYKSNKHNLAKSPPRMFKGIMINDLGKVAKGVADYYNKKDIKK